MDQDWTDIFWDLRERGSSDIDTHYLRFFEVVALFDACEKAKSDRHSIEEASRNGFPHYAQEVTYFSCGV